MPSHVKDVSLVDHNPSTSSISNNTWSIFVDLGDQVTELTTLRAPMVELTGHMGVVMSADWMTGGEQVITASWDRLAILHDAETGEQISNLTGNPDITDGNQN